MLVVALCDYYVITIGLLYNYLGIAVGLPWDYYGITVSTSGGCCTAPDANSGTTTPRAGGNAAAAWLASWLALALALDYAVGGDGALSDGTRSRLMSSDGGLVSDDGGQRDG